MIVKKFLESFGLIYSNLKNYINKIYQNSNLYDKKISKTYSITFNYKPSPHLLSSLIKYQKKNIKLKTFHSNLFGPTILIQKTIRN
jgi:hypothetical protein